MEKGQERVKRKLIDAAERLEWIGHLERESAVWASNR